MQGIQSILLRRMFGKKKLHPTEVIFYAEMAEKLLLLPWRTVALVVNYLPWLHILSPACILQDSEWVDIQLFLSREKSTIFGVFDDSDSESAKKNPASQT